MSIWTQEHDEFEKKNHKLFEHSAPKEILCIKAIQSFQKKIEWVNEPNNIGSKEMYATPQ